MFRGLHIGNCLDSVDERAMGAPFASNKSQGADLGGLPLFYCLSRLAGGALTGIGWSLGIPQTHRCHQFPVPLGI